MKPRNRPNATMTSAHTASISTSGRPRWWSMTLNSATPGGASARWDSTTLSPTASVGAPAPWGRSTLTVWPDPAPVLMCTVALPQAWPGFGPAVVVPSPVAGQAVWVTERTSPYPRWSPELAGALGLELEPGQSRISATTVSTADGIRIAVDHLGGVGRDRRVGRGVAVAVGGGVAALGHGSTLSSHAMSGTARGITRLTGVQSWDVVVVGGGPAGLAAAHAAATRGARTLVLERAEHPRYKTCGGGLIGPSLAAAIGFEVPVREHVAPGHVHPRRPARVHPGGGAAAAAGRWCSGTSSTRRCADGPSRPAPRSASAPWSVRSRNSTRGYGSGWPTARRSPAGCVVGADGSAGVTARHVGVELDQVDLGLEIDVPTPEAERDTGGAACSSTGGRCPARTAGSSRRATCSRSA